MFDITRQIFYIITPDIGKEVLGSLQAVHCYKQYKLLNISNGIK